MSTSLGRKAFGAFAQRLTYTAVSDRLLRCLNKSIYLLSTGTSPQSVLRRTDMREQLGGTQ